MFGYPSKNTIKRVDNDFLNLAVKLREEIGSGSYGKVYRAQRIDIKTDQRDYAAKVILLKKAPKDFLAKFLPREINICVLLKHPNIVQTHDIINTPDKCVMLMEYASKGDLLSYCRLRGALAETHAQQLFKQIADGLDYLHQNLIIHRDLKCENILLASCNRCLIADFGFARVLKGNDVSSTFCGSAAYAAPELLTGKQYNSFSSDIWSIGCILFVMLCHRMPFRDDTVAIIIKEQKSPPKIPRDIDKGLSSNARSVLHRMISYEPRRRISMPDLLRDIWLEEGAKTNEIWSSKIKVKHPLRTANKT